MESSVSRQLLKILRMHNRRMKNESYGLIKQHFVEVVDEERRQFFANCISRIVFASERRKLISVFKELAYKPEPEQAEEVMQLNEIGESQPIVVVEDVEDSNIEPADQPAVEAP
jgi:hypothetical protein